MLEAFQYQFFQNALIVAVLASLAAGIIGTYIVVRRMSLISGSIAHTAFGGLGIGYFFNFNPLIGGVVFSLLAAFIIAVFRRTGSNRFDTLLSFLWATGMAIGLVFIFLTPGYAKDLFTYLFGNILLVSRMDLLMIFFLDLIITGAVLLMFNSFLSVTFDEEHSETRNMPVTLVNVILFSLIALTIVATIRVVGIVLMIAILTMPAATAQLFHKTVKGMMVTSFLITLFAAIAGLFVSYYLNFATGPIIVLIISFIYVIAPFLRKIRAMFLVRKTPY
ncbi:metal ABC transporter permease [Candidatus Woesearchaeota archaeon]|nr:metal ABC transporter permease [Candidatus Woesearchaeota archaeon]